MRNTMLHLCENIMGAKLGYTQSDEITLLITDDDTFETDAWFGKNLQKIVSVSAAMATYYFNKEVAVRVSEETASPGLKIAYENGRQAFFDARAFLVPREEVINVFEWRQQDCTRNSIQSVGQSVFSQKELHCKSCNDIQNMLFTQKGINWNDYATGLKRGVCAKQEPILISENTYRMKWTLHENIPIFHEYPNYINELVYHRKEVEE